MPIARDRVADVLGGLRSGYQVDGREVSPSQLLERVTDQQYAILDGRLRHLPGGIDEYLKLAAEPAPERAGPPATSCGPPVMSGAELRAVEKEIAAIDRRLGRLGDQIAAKHAELAAHDQSDHVGINRLTRELRGPEDDVAGLENRWLQLSEMLE